jgi:thioredoxin-related protein
MNARLRAPRIFIGRVMVASVLLASSLVSAAQSLLPPASDLMADAKRVESTGAPLIMLISLPGCPHCEMVRRSHLLPLLQAGVSSRKPLIRQVELNGQDMMRNFAGRAMTHAEFARQYKFKIAPVVMFLDSKGNMLTEPLVGSMIPDFYGAYFDAALAEATSKLTATRP